MTKEILEEFERRIGHQLKDREKGVFLELIGKLGERVVRAEWQRPKMVMDKMTYYYEAKNLKKQVEELKAENKAQHEGHEIIVDSFDKKLEELKECNKLVVDKLSCLDTKIMSGCQSNTIMTSIDILRECLNNY